ncbi:MAG: M42 family peptidase, partial [Oscillospiraceae bacterium]|nr:M42 family peptidase [Oscillospiraceae bacterium]
RTRGIPHQLEVMEGNTGTNGWKMQIVREGIPTMVVSLPLKYMHSPVETLSLDDLESVAALLAAFVESLGEGGALNA